MSDEAKPVGLIDPPKLPTSRGDIAAFTICSGLAYLLDTMHNFYGIPPGAASVYCGSIAVGIKNALQSWFEYQRQEKERQIVEATERRRAEQKRSELISKVKRLMARRYQDAEFVDAGQFSKFAYSLEVDLDLFGEGILTSEDFEKGYDSALNSYREFRLQQYKKRI